VKKLFRSKQKAGYSLFEVLITLTIVTIIMIMLTNTLLLSLEISRKSLVRSSLREEQNDILNKISKDIRNARFIENCGNASGGTTCEVLLDRKYTWTICDDTGQQYICKKVGNETEEQIIERTSDQLIVKEFTIDEGIVESDGKKSIVITLVVNQNSEGIDIEDQIRQVLVSTRNYTI